jgi:hypothetical protein
MKIPDMHLVVLIPPFSQKRSNTLLIQQQRASWYRKMGEFTADIVMT